MKLVKDAKAERYHEIMVEWNLVKNSMGIGFLRMGKCLSILKQEQLWRLDGNQNLTFRSWIEGELKICYSQAMRLIQVFEQVGDYLTNKDLEGIDIYKIVLLLPHLKGKNDEEKIDMLYMAKDCTVDHIKQNLREGKGLPTKDTCDHEKYEQELWNRCPNCGRWSKG
jgi:hypothetical protein